MTNTSSTTRQSASIVILLPMMLSFFAMGFVDLVGIASNYVQKDFHLSHAEANLFVMTIGTVYLAAYTLKIQQ